MTLVVFYLGLLRMEKSVRVNAVWSVGVRETNKQSPDVLVHMCGGGKGGGVILLLPSIRFQTAARRS